MPQLLWTLVLAFPLLRSKDNAVVSCLIIGVLWGLWHLPLFLLPGTSQYVLVTQHPPGILRFAGFVVQTTALSVLFGWLVIRTSGSVPIAMVFHIRANMAYSVLAVLGVYAAWQALLSYVGLLEGYTSLLPLGNSRLGDCSYGTRLVYSLSLRVCQATGKSTGR